jgi:pyruvate-ferredoxin/flavodoxin oxidoreductase
MNYGHVYVAQIAFGANMNQTVKALQEAESYPGTSLVISYSPCIAHGYNLSHGGEQQKRIVQSGVWPLYRFDPRRSAVGEPALQLDSKAPSLRVNDFVQGEARFKMVENLDPARFKGLMAESQRNAEAKYPLLKRMSLADQEIHQSAASAANLTSGES